MKHSTALTVALGAALVLPALTATTAAAASAPDGLSFEVATVNGSGCPAGTVSVALSNDDDGDDFLLTVRTSAMRAEGTGGSPQTAFRKNCQISLKTHVPEEKTFAVRQVDYYGAAQLEPGASGTLKETRYFQGMATAPAETKTFSGPYSGAWAHSSQRFSDLLFRPCGEDRNFNIIQEVQAERGTSDPSKAISTGIEGTGRTVYHLDLKNCFWR
ncbi:DUF4360 domain-containing protein [Actinomadura syzygii]|uniref:DUF4360 domain-containing protein n=1 Tax=Actinomadura syzygii TaxID=1427538 RepID=A0A5D0TYL2_9ACTN|nr:DUF4360 domain-containing protein [Actinomadura syzygii]TYC09989.1 DUF4360 domain-containing protein [Actinomadura syzygii]